MSDEKSGSKISRRDFLRGKWSDKKKDDTPMTEHPEDTVEHKPEDVLEEKSEEKPREISRRDFLRGKWFR